MLASNDEYLMMVLSQAASMANTHEADAQLDGFFVHDGLQILTDTAGGLVQHGQPRLVVE